MIFLKWIIKIPVMIKNWFDNLAERKALERKKFYHKINSETRKKRIKKMIENERKIFD